MSLLVMVRVVCVKWDPNEVEVTPADPVVGQEALLRELAVGPEVLRCVTRPRDGGGTESFVAQRGINLPVVIRYFWLWQDTDGRVVINERALVEAPDEEEWPEEFIRPLED